MRITLCLIISLLNLISENTARQVKGRGGALTILTILTIKVLFGLFNYEYQKYYAIINRARGPYEEIFVLTFKSYERTQ